jgi:hypothetical protein
MHESCWCNDDDDDDDGAHRRGVLRGDFVEADVRVAASGNILPVRREAQRIHLLKEIDKGTQRERERERGRYGA